MDKVIKGIKEKGEQLTTTIGFRNLIPIKISSLLYADDIVLVAKTKNKMQRLVNVWTNEIENLKMEFRKDQGDDSK